jgi:hypothetical protein
MGFEPRNLQFNVNQRFDQNFISFQTTLFHRNQSKSHKKVNLIFPVNNTQKIKI